MPKSTKNINWPLIIIVATVFVSATRWIPALMRSEGFEIPVMWLTWWVPVSALLAVGQPIVEAVSIAFALNAYRYMKNDSQKNLMLVLIGGTLVSFVGVLTPNIVASGSSRSVYALLGDWMWFWGISVVLSTVMPVSAVAFGAARMSETVTHKTINEQRKEVGLSTADNQKEPFAEVADDGKLQQRVEKMVEIADSIPELPTEPMHEQTPRPDLVETKPEDAKVYTATPDSRIVVNGYQGFADYMNGLKEGHGPKNGNQVSEMFKASKKTGYAWWNRWNTENGTMKEESQK